MNKEDIDKWLDEEYGCSYTRLEELHDFWFEKYTDLQEIEKEHQRINGDLRVENKELKEKYMKLEDKYIHNVPCCNEEDCDLFCEHQKLKDRIDKAIEYINKKAIKKEIQETRNIVNIIYSLKLNNYEFIELEDILKGDSNE